MVAELLVEIGTEEIPSGYIRGAVQELRRRTRDQLREVRVDLAGGIYAYGTPRRLVLIGKAVAERQEDMVHDVNGPPRSVSFDSDGKPTKAAVGFAEKQGVTVDALEIKDTPKGEYLFVRTRVPGRPSIEVLSEILPGIIGDLPWPKSMRWGSVGFPFARPIHWVLALFDGVVIPFELAGVQSGNTTRGHRFMSPEVMEIGGVEDYLAKMQRSYVEIDQAERERIIRRIVTASAHCVGGEPMNDPDLISTVANLVEYPTAVCGGFEETFLSLPEPVLITAMKEHQKYFAVYDAAGRLMPHFVAVNNTLARNQDVVRRGHERVLRARLSDAAFFFREDRKRRLLDRLEDLKGVIYQAELGTSYAKVQRFMKLSDYLAERYVPGKREGVRTVAELCKCDLVTQMVAEFPSLQGVMGTEYARLEGYPEEVCQAIQDHYLPTRAGGELPGSPVGAVAGVSDRMDTIVGCFAIGKEPSGTADPFALRRHALAIIRIIEEMGWELPLEDFVDKALEILGGEISFEREAVRARVMGFFRERYKQMMLRSGYETDLVEAILSVDFSHVCRLRSRIDQLKRFSEEAEEFEALALTFKRVTNILKNQNESYAVDPAFFREPCEGRLWETVQGLRGDILESLDQRDYLKALQLMIRFRKPVDDFFDGAEILTKEDPKLKDNRVGVLQHVAGLFLKVADLSKFSI